MSIIGEYRDEISAFLDEYRRKDQKNEIVSRDLLVFLIKEKNPELGKISEKALKGMVTALVERKGGRRLEKANSRHLKYYWPIPQEAEA